MPSNKDRVASYLEDDESQALSEFCKEKGMTGSQGIAHLIRTNLIESDDETTKEAKLDHLYNERLSRLEKTLDNWQTTCFRALSSNEKLQEQLANIESEFDRVKREQAAASRYDDETIAAITGQSKEKVYLWRMGQIKPRGCRILEKLAPYEVKEGRWTRKG